MTGFREALHTLQQQTATEATLFQSYTAALQHVIPEANDP